MRTILLICLFLFPAMSSYALQGHRGDIMVAEAPFESPIPDIMLVQNKLRAMNEALLIMQVPQYQFDDWIIDQQLIQENFIFHVEILPCNWNFEDGGGWIWRRYRFTDFGKSMLDPGRAGDIYKWITDRTDHYKIPFNEVSEAYRQYADGAIELGAIPLMMIGTDYGQSIRDYTNFRDFYNKFMNKHHYCITASMWGILKAIYDKSPGMRRIYESNLRDSQSVQAFDTLTGGRLLGFLLNIGFIEEY